MQGDAKKKIRNVGLFAGTPPTPAPVPGGPNRYTGKQFEYFEMPTSDFIWNNAQYASNYYKAHVQGVIPGTFETERGAYIRSQDIVEQTTGAKMPNDYQSIYFQDTRIKGLYTGAKVKFAGNTWLAISPFNISDPLSSSVIRRCNAMWKYLDYYGNVKMEPFVFQDGRTQSSANEYLDWSVIPNWYQKCVIQLNDETKELAYNKRMILGSSAVELRGISDFITDFSGSDIEEQESPEPPHALFFDVQFQQPLEIDDMERGIAGGKAFKWQIMPSIPGEIRIGDEQPISVYSLRNGENADDGKHEITYLFTSSDPSVATVSLLGVVTGVSEGTATITVTLEQNPEITATLEVSVSATAPEAQIVFTPELPGKLKQMQSYSGTVSVMQGAAKVNTPITMMAFGATESADFAFNSADDSLSVQCYEPNLMPLSLVFKADAYNLVCTRNIQLEGY